MYSRLLLLLATVAGIACPAGAVDITGCGQTVPEGQVGRLLSDLVCSPTDVFTFDFGVMVEPGATLDLGGHSITMNHDGGNLAAIVCNDGCVVMSPAGTADITGLGPRFSFTAGVQMGRRSRVSEVHVRGFSYGIATGADGSRIFLTNVTATDNEGFGIGIADHLVARNVNASHNGGGIGIDRSIVGADITANDNTYLGIDAGSRIRARNVTITGNGECGIDASAGKNGRTGSISLLDSNVTGNGTADLISGHRPLLRSTACGASEHRDADGVSFGTWGVCSLD